MTFLASSRTASVYPLLALGLVAEVALSLLVGGLPIPPATIVAILGDLAVHGGGVGTETQRLVVSDVRLPRVLLALLAGGGLGLAGAALQGLFRNPLVGPDVLGVSGGAACGGVFAILAGLPTLGVTGAAFAGGLAAISAAGALAKLARSGGLLMTVLGGLVVGGFASALLVLAEYLADPQETLPEIVFWLLGSFVGADRTKVAVLAGAVLLGGSALLALRWRLNVLSLGDADARALGVRPGPLRWTILGLVSLIVAAQVAVSGVIGWVGLIVPHFARLLVGPDHRKLLPASAAVGAGFVLGIDDLARVFPDQELPIGLLTALIGTPVFAALLWRAGRSGWRNE